MSTACRRIPPEQTVEVSFDSSYSIRTGLKANQSNQGRRVTSRVVSRYTRRPHAGSVSARRTNSKLPISCNAVLGSLLLRRKPSRVKVWSNPPLADTSTKSSGLDGDWFSIAVINLKVVPLVRVRRTKNLCEFIVEGCSREPGITSFGYENRCRLGLAVRQPVLD
jgi:hypothetical protein